MNVHRVPPPGWDDLVESACQRVGFARAMAHLGYRPLFLVEESHGALALVRGWVPMIRRFTARANLFAPGAPATFVCRALSALASLGIPFIRAGDTMWGVRWCEEDGRSRFSRARTIQRHTFIVDLAQEVETLSKKQDGSVRTSLRKAEREGVTVREIVSGADLEAYCRLASVTSARIRSFTAHTDFPAVFFRELHAALTPSGATRFYMAVLNDVPLAGAVFLCSGETMVYFAGASTRDRQYTALQAPTAVLWHAIRDAKRRGLARFDLGGCTPTEDRKDPRYGVYAFKKRWGGHMETFQNLEVVLGPVRHRMQERVFAPLWDRAHPMYFRLLQTIRVR